MSDVKYYKRLAETWERNAQFYLREIERANWLYSELLKKYEELERMYKMLEQKPRGRTGPCEWCGHE